MGLRHGIGASSSLVMDIRFHTPLTAKEQLNFGLDAPQPLALADKVRFAELDPLNHVNNKAYIEWFETLRVSYFDNLCAFCYDGIEAPRLVIRSANIHYVREMVMGEVYVTTARVSGFRNTSFTIEQQLWSGDLRATLTGVMVTLRSDGSGRYPLPQTLREVFIKRDGATPEG